MSREKRASKKGTSRSVQKRARTGDEGASEEDKPVQIQKIRYGTQSKDVPSIPLAPKLIDLLYPLSPDEFMSKILRSSALHVTCEEGEEEEHAKRRVSTLCKEMFDLEPEALFRESSSDSIFLWLRDKNNNDGSNNGGKQAPIRSIEISDPDTALALHKTAGHATYCRAPPKVEQNLVASLLKETGLGCGQYDPSGESLVSMGRGEVETFISTNGHVTDWHFDFQENFTIQLSGTKRWTLQQGTIRDPIRGCTPHYAAPEAVESQLKAAHLFDRKFRFGFPETGVTARGSVMSVVVKPGDVFYFPAGMWHKVEAIEPGVSINVSLMASNYATVTCQALQQILHRDERWREPILNNSSHNPVHHLKKLLRDLPSMIQQLERHGAASIIPPVLEHPPSFVQTQEEEEEEEDSELDDVPQSEEDENDDEEEEEARRGEEEIYSESAELDTEDTEDIVNAEGFNDYPIGWSVGFEAGSRVRLWRNPLSALHRLSDISSFYCSDQKKCQKGIFVLNVNYAGNEMHQSVVRVVFSDNANSFVDELYAWERKSKDKPIDLLIPEENFPLAKFLVFHGYLHVEGM